MPDAGKRLQQYHIHGEQDRETDEGNSGGNAAERSRSRSSSESSMYEEPEDMPAPEDTGTETDQISVRGRRNANGRINPRESSTAGGTSVTRPREGDDATREPNEKESSTESRAEVAR